MIYPSIIRDGKATAGSPSKMSLIDLYLSASDDEKFGISRNALEWWSIYEFKGPTHTPSSGGDEGDKFLENKVTLHGKAGGDYYAMKWLQTNAPNQANPPGLRTLFVAVISGGRINLVPSDPDLKKDQTYQNAMIFFTGLALSTDIADMKKRSEYVQGRARTSLIGHPKSDHGKQKEVYDGAVDRIEGEFSKLPEIGDIEGKLTRLQPFTAATPTPTPTGVEEDLKRKIERLERLLASQRKSTNDRIKETKEILEKNLGDMNTAQFVTLVRRMNRQKLFEPIPEPK